MQTSYTHFILSFKKAVKKHPTESLTACTEIACWVCLALPFSHAEALHMLGFLFKVKHISDNGIHLTVNYSPVWLHSIVELFVPDCLTLSVFFFFFRLVHFFYSFSHL